MHWDWEPLCEAMLCLNYAAMAVARPLRALQPATESQPIVAAARAGGPLQAPGYKARYDVRSPELETIDEFGAGAGNRKSTFDRRARVTSRSSSRTRCCTTNYGSTTSASIPGNSVGRSPLKKPALR